MLKEGKFGAQEAISLITITIVSRVFFTSPSVITRYVGTAGWYMTLISAATSAIGFTFIYLLIKMFPKHDLVEIFEMVLGTYIGSIFSLLIFSLFLIDLGGVIREFTEVMKVYVLPISPPSYIISILMVGVIVLGTLGLESQARFARLISPFLLASLILVLLLGIQNYEIHRIRPILGYGLGNTIKHGISRNSVYGYTIIAAFIAKSLHGPKYIKKIGYTSIVLASILVSLCLVAFSLTFPYYIAQEATSPLYQMTALIDYGRFFQRLDPLFLFVWNISTLIAVSIELYISASIYCKVFKIEDLTPIILPLSIICFTIAMMPADLESVALGYINTLRGYSWVGVYTPIFVTLIVAWIKSAVKRKKKRKVKGNKIVR